MRHFEMARDRVLMGQRRESMALSDREKEAIAYHEAGHAVCAAVLPHADPVHKVTILPDGHGPRRHPAAARSRSATSTARTTSRTASSSAWAAASPRSSCSAWSPPAPTTTSSAATELARKMVREWGMSERVGPMAWGSQGQVFLGEDLMHTRDYSDDTARVIDEEVERILREQEERCREHAHRAPQRPRPRGPGPARARDDRRRRGRAPHRRGRQAATGSKESGERRVTVPEDRLEPPT